ncbi:MAG: DNA-directed RNA polymerase subunit G [Sulfolobales archaeon]
MSQRQRRGRAGGELRRRVKVLSIADSRIPRVKIIELGGDGLKISMDLHSELIVFSEGEELEMVISKNIPAYREGRDFCARGVVVSLRGGDKVERVIISLWGYLVILRIEDPSLLEGLELQPTDQIYYCLIKQG